MIGLHKWRKTFVGYARERNYCCLCSYEEDVMCGEHMDNIDRILSYMLVGFFASPIFVMVYMLWVA